MKRSLDRQLVPSFDFFQDLFQSDEVFIKALRYCSGVLVDNNTRVLRNMKLLREVGVPESNVIKLWQIYPRTVTKSSNRFKMIMKELHEMGFDPSKYLFIIAVYALSSISKCTWSKKADVYKKWGFSEDEIISAFRKSPFFMKKSEDKIDTIMEILVGKLGYPPFITQKYAVVLHLSVDKRICPRASVLQVLLSKGLARKESSLSMFIYSERRFLERCKRYEEDEGCELLKLYQAKLDLAT